MLFKVLKNFSKIPNLSFFLLEILTGKSVILSVGYLSQEFIMHEVITEGLLDLLGYLIKIMAKTILY